MEIFDHLFMEFASPLSWRIALERLGSSLALSSIVGSFYLQFSSSRVGRNSFVFTLIILGMVSSIIAGIIASSVALSIGMVGSISIIRFRTRLNQPQQLILVFLVMAAGLGIGLEKAAFSWVATICILLIWGFKSLLEVRAGNPATLLIKTQNAKPLLGEIEKLKIPFRLVEYLASENLCKLKLFFEKAPENFPEKLSKSLSTIPDIVFEFKFNEDEG